MELKEVFEPIMKFMKNFQKKEKDRDKDISKQAAKDRLKLVLMQDRASVSPDFFEMMKKEIIDVIKKYIEIDEESLEVQLTRGFEAGLEGPALYANIPIKNIKPVASKVDGEENVDEERMQDIADSIAEDILNEAESKVADALKPENIEVVIEKADELEVKEDAEVASAEVVDEVSTEPVVTEELKVESIAENVAKEMKKSLKASTAATKTTKTATKTSAKKGTTSKAKVVKKAE